MMERLRCEWHWLNPYTYLTTCRLAWNGEAFYQYLSTGLLRIDDKRLTGVSFCILVKRFVFAQEAAKSLALRRLPLCQMRKISLSYHS